MKEKAKEPVVKLLARTSSKSVLKHTGESWDHWLAVLKKSQASHLTHKEIVQLLKTKYKLTPWWQVYVITKAKDRCHLVFSHEQLANSRIKEKQRTYWKQKANELERVLLDQR